MTSAMTTADACEMWLRIARGSLPPHHYALLGLPPFTADEQAIFQAYQQRATLVGQHLGGPDALTAKRLLGELAAAQACLLNPETRAAYDRILSQRATGTATAASAAEPPNAAQRQRPAPRGKGEPPIGAPPAAEEPAAPPVSGYHEGEEPSSVVPWLVGGACTGLLAVALLGIVLFSMGRKPPRNNIAQRPKNATTTAAEAKRPTSKIDDKRIDGVHDEMGGNRKLVIEVYDDDVLGERIAPLTTKPETIDTSTIGPPLAGDDPAAELAELGVEDGAAKPMPSKPPAPPATEASDSPAPADESPSAAAVLAALPKSVALPARSNMSSELLLRLPTKKTSSLALSLTAVGAGEGSGFTLAAEEPGVADGERVWPVQSASGGASRRTVGEYALAGDELSFRWLEGASANDELLANVALAVSVDGKAIEINQRTPSAVAPLKLSVDSGAVSTTAKIDAPPPSAKLYLSLAQQDEAFPAHVLHPEEPVAAGQSIQVIFGEATDPYRLALQVTLVENGAGGTRIESRPMFQTIDEGQKWDYFRPKAVLQTLAQHKQQDALIGAQLQQLPQRFGRNSLQLQQATELYNRQAAALQTRILSLERIHALCEELNASALNYRIFTKLGEREIDLADSTLGIALSAGESKPAADSEGAIVGPPTAGD